MYEGYIIECPPMEQMYWEFIRLTCPDEPEEIHELTSRSINKLNYHITAITSYLRDIIDNATFIFTSIDEFISYALDEYPSTIDGNILSLYLDNAEIILPLISTTHESRLVVLDREGSIAILME